MGVTLSDEEMKELQDAADKYIIHFGLDKIWYNQLSKKFEKELAEKEKERAEKEALLKKERAEKEALLKKERAEKEKERAEKEVLLEKIEFFKQQVVELQKKA